MSPRRRLGVALLVDRPHSDEIDGLRRAVGDRSLARVPAHVTLVPPVNVRVAEMASALAVLRRAAARAGRPLTLTLGPPATFLPSNPVLYLTVGGDVPQLAHLREDVFVPPLRRSLAWPWVPHVTVADDADPTRIAAAVEALRGYQIVVNLDRVVLLEERRPVAGVGEADADREVAAGSGGAVRSRGTVEWGSAVGSGRRWGPEGPVGSGTRRWVPVADASLAVPAVVGRGGVELTLVLGRELGSDALELLAEGGTEGGGPGLEGAPLADGGRDAGELGPPIVVSGLVDGSLVGVARAWRSDAGGLVGVLVAPDRRGAGIGRHLLVHAEDAVRRAGWACPHLRAIGPPGFYRACSDWSVPVSPAPREG